MPDLPKGNESDDADRQTDKDAVIAAVRDIVRNYQKLPVLDDRSPDEIIGYDDFGVPD